MLSNTSSLLDQHETVQAIIATKRAELMLAHTTQTHAAQRAQWAQTQRDHHQRARHLQQLVASMQHARAALAQHVAVMDATLATAIADLGSAFTVGVHTVHTSLAAHVLHHHDALVAACSSMLVQRLQRLEHRLDQCSASLKRVQAPTHTSSDSVDVGTRAPGQAAQPHGP